MSFDDIISVLSTTPQTAENIAIAANISVRTARENLRRAYRRGFVQRKPTHHCGGFVYWSV